MSNSDIFNVYTKSDRGNLTIKTAAPQITNVLYSELFRVNKPVNLEVWGYQFNLGTLNEAARGSSLQVYLSTDTNMFSSQRVNVDIFSSIGSLSADNPPFTGQQISYSLLNNNKIILYMPTPTKPGNLNIIVVNEVGYTTLLTHGDGLISVVS